jgi:large subunit ribosomal protein L2
MSTIKLYKPTTASRRHTSVVNYRDILTTNNNPYKKLTVRQKTNAGRNNSGKITVRHRGGGARQLIRIVNFKQNFPEGVKVLTVEYDPTRTAFINLVTDLKTGKKQYILHTKGTEVGNIIKYQTDEIKDGNSVMLKIVPIGSFVSQIEAEPSSGSKLVRSAGVYAIVTARDEGYVSLKLPSGEVKKFSENCACVISRVGNEVHGQVRLGKAGRKRHMGIRPTVRGKVMNPVDHPHGGGEARNSIGMPYPKTPWGKHALGVKTRDKKKKSSKFIVSRKRKK